MHNLTKRWFIVFLIFIICNCSKTINHSPNLSVNKEPQEVYEDSRKLTILYTNDEHGSVEKTHSSNGAEHMMGLRRDIEDYAGDNSYWILSGGDNWLG